MFKIGNNFGNKFKKGHKINVGLKRPPRSIEWKENQRKAQIGKKRSEETKRKISQASAGNKYGLGYKHTDEAKKKMSLARKGKVFITKEGRKILSELKTGYNNPNWKGGITPLLYKIRNCFKYRQWRSDIFTRDNFICQECQTRGSYLEAHHIKSFSSIIGENSIKTYEEALNCEELWNLNNGITLCKKCHNKTKNGRSIKIK